jgi:hypothetical protein
MRVFYFYFILVRVKVYRTLKYNHHGTSNPANKE